MTSSATIAASVLQEPEHRCITMRKTSDKDEYEKANELLEMQLKETDRLTSLAADFGVEPRKLLSHVLLYEVDIKKTISTSIRSDFQTVSCLFFFAGLMKEDSLFPPDRMGHSPLPLSLQ